MGSYEFGTGFSTGSVWDWYGLCLRFAMGFVGGFNY